MTVPASAWPEGTRPSEGEVPVLSRVAHDRAHLARSLPDPTESEEARWFTRDELIRGEGPAVLPPPVSIARHILDRWVAGEFS